MKRMLTAFCGVLPLLSFAGIVPGSATNYLDAAGFVNLDYRVEGDPCVVTFEVATNGVVLGGDVIRRVDGDVWKLVRPGSRKIRWRADRDLPGRTFAKGEIAVNAVAWPTNNPPPYLVVNCATSNFNYYVTADQLPSGGLANRIYTSHRIVMRRIPAAYKTWRRRGNDSHEVLLTKDYYMGIYKVTDGQGSNTGTYNGAPKRCWGYEQMRDNTWPTGRTATKGVIGGLATRFGVPFDLPTDAQWEFAARAGEYAHDLYTGKNLDADANGISTNLDEIAWYGYNSQVGGVCTVREVGLKKPNAFGLYDMLGLHWEWVLDWNGGDPAQGIGAAVDPEGASTGSTRKRRGGCFNLAASNCTLSNVSTYYPTYSNENVTGVDGKKLSSGTYISGRPVLPAIAYK